MTHADKYSGDAFIIPDLKRKEPTMFCQKFFINIVSHKNTHTRAKNTNLLFFILNLEKLIVSINCVTEVTTLLFCLTSFNLYVPTDFKRILGSLFSWQICSVNYSPQFASQSIKP